MNTTVPNVTPETTLADLRLGSDKTTYEVAEALGITQPRISQMEKTGTVPAQHLRAMAAAYGVSIDDLLLVAEQTRSSKR